MARFVLRRLALVLPTFVGITLLAFSLIHLIPGDPVQVMAGERRLDPAFHAEIVQRLGLDRPLHEQYLAYLGKALHGDLGESFVSHEPVWREFGRLFPATAELSFFALLLALPLGLLAGVLAALKRGSLLDHGVMGLALTGFSMPIFWWGLLLIMFFSVAMRDIAPLLALPVSGRIALEFDIPVRSGFMVIDAIARDYSCATLRPRFQGKLGEIALAGERVLLLKPETYMNESGRSVGEATRFFKIDVADVVVFHDELDLAPGKVRVKAGRFNAGRGQVFPCGHCV